MPAWYEPLLALLAVQPADTTTLTLTLAEIQALACGPLPASFATRTYWQRGGRGIHQRLAAAGWRVWRVGDRASLITFVRLSGETA